jgi:bifunctional ADP-heptose synthase (sugar kinase/adenylyltransferase)
LRKDLKNSRVLVVGDTIVDKDIFLDAVGLSLESPTLKTNFITERKSLGGAANVAKLIGLLGSECTFVTGLSDPQLLNSLHEDFGVNTISSDSGRDNTKTRYWISRGDGTYKYLQVNDCGYASPASESFSVDGYDAVLVCDYRCGFVTDGLVDKCKGFIGTKFVSSQMSDRGSNMNRYVGFDCALMNESEDSCCVVSFPKKIVTMGSRGSKTIVVDEDPIHHEPVTINTSNTIGAGDAFCAAYVCTENGEFANMFASYYLSLPTRDAASLKEMMNRE